MQYSGLKLNRGDLLRRNQEELEQLWNHEQCRIIPVLENRNLFTLLSQEAPANKTVRAAIHTRKELAAYLEQAQHRTFLGFSADIPYFSVEVCADHQDSLTAYVAGKFIDLRSVGPQLDQATSSLLAYARALTYWQRHNRFCPVCGHHLLPTHGGHILRCSNEPCGHLIYPRTDPAVIMLVQRTSETGVRQCLLGRHPQWTGNTLSTLAGFVEPGESLEEAVRREVTEESGILVGDVSYIASQPWPFPSSIMLGFFAEAISSEIILDPHELAEAYWFSKADLEAFGEWGEEGTDFTLPRQDSISRFLIKRWMELQD
ncbi:MAG: NAD(+) diphosphatase [Thiolinea sp.]